MPQPGSATTQSPVLLQAQHLGRKEGPNWRLRDLNLCLQPGDTLGLLGLNGSGKSTALALLAGTLAPSQGRVWVQGIDLHRHPRQAKRYLGLLPEQPPLYPGLSVDENLEFAARLRGMNKKQAQHACNRVKNDLNLDTLGRRLCGRLSKGQRQRVGIAQALIHRPNVLILDEPTAGLDPAQAQHLRELIAQAIPEQALIIATHLLPDIEQLCQRVLVLHDGRLLGEEKLDTQHQARFQLLPPWPSIQALEALPSIERAYGESNGWFRVQLRSSTSELAQQLISQGWRLQALLPGIDLEQRLLQLLNQTSMLQEMTTDDPH